MYVHECCESVCVCVSVCISVCVSVYVHDCICVSMSMHVCECVCVHMRTCACTLYMQEPTEGGWRESDLLELWEVLGTEPRFSTKAFSTLYCCAIL